MSEGVRCLAGGVIACLLGLLLRESGFKGASLIGVVASVGIFGASVIGVERIVGALERELSFDGASELIASALRLIGVGYAFGMGADLCREVGSQSVANALLVAGRVEILLISLPHLLDLIRLVGGFLS